MIHRTASIRRWKQWLALPLVALLTFTVACERNTDSIAPVKRASSQNSEVPPPPPPPPLAPDAEPAPPPPPTPTKNTRIEIDSISHTQQSPQPTPSKNTRIEIDKMPLSSVEEMPSFPTGNNNDIVTYIQSKLKYPTEAVRNKVKGRVIISFVIDKEGNVTDAFIEKGIGSGCDEAALNAVRQLPRFGPGKQDGQPVAVRFVVPIQFEPYSAPISNLLGSLGGSPKC
jgi:TonB family protein